jgi:hypothetical protein
MMAAQRQREVNAATRPQTGYRADVVHRCWSTPDQHQAIDAVQEANGTGALRHAGHF